MNNHLKVIPKKIEALQASVLSMIDAGMDRFDPARFHYIQTLCNKAIQESDAVADLLCMKAVKARDRYEADIKRSLKSASEWVERASRLSPDSKAMLDSLVACYEILSAQRMAKKVVQRHEAKYKPSLASLFVDNESGLDDEPSLSFEKQLLHHEITVQNLISGDDEAEDVTERYQFSDLKSYHLFKETSIKLHADYLVARAIDEVPENAGPLNSHRLAVNSIQMMKDISPAYVRRFVSYMDTLLWLEKATKESGKIGKNPLKPKSFKSK